MAEIVRRASGKSLRDFAEENIFRPLGMVNTHFNDDREDIVKNRAVSYAPHGSGRYRQFVNTIEVIGASNLLTTVEDLAKWDQNFYDNKIGGEGFNQAMPRGTKLNGREIPYGFGLLSETYKGLKAVRHNGQFWGYTAEMIRFPEQRFTVICLCNTTAANAEALAKQVADIYLADQLKPAEAKPNSPQASSSPPQPLVLTAEQMAEYTGTYYSEELDTTYRIFIEGGNLFFKMRNLTFRWSLSARGKDEFQPQDRSFSFTRNDQRQIIGFIVIRPRVKGIRFIRKAN
jgi:CubicO group peptidase (beta-lactamase class C family)